MDNFSEKGIILQSTWKRTKTQNQPTNQPKPNEETWETLERGWEQKFRNSLTWWKPSGIRDKSQSCVKFPDLIGKNLHCWETLGALNSNLFDLKILQEQIEEISTRNQSIHSNPVDLQSLNIF